MRRYIPVIVLFLLAPFIAEVINGSTPYSNLDSLIAVAPLYGAGALLIREAVRRRGGRWGRIALLGAAYAIIEEGLALQTFFNPTLFNAAAYGGRALGVNWVWTQWAVGYHIIWSIVLPILLAELLFPQQRTAAWLGRIGLVVTGLLYLLAVIAHALIFRLIVAPGYEAPLPLIIGAAVLAIGLIVAVLGGMPRLSVSLAENRPIHAAPSPWLIGLLAFLGGTLWFELFNLPAAMRPFPMVLLPMLGILVVEAGLVTLIRRWSMPDRRWTDLHRLALVIGPLLTTMLTGHFFVTAGSPADQLFQGIVSLVFLLSLAIFAYTLRRREQTVPIMAHPEVNL